MASSSTLTTRKKQPPKSADQSSTKKRRKATPPSSVEPEQPGLEPTEPSIEPNQIRVRCQQEALHTALEDVRRFVLSKPPQPILANVLMEVDEDSQKIWLTVYNLKTAARRSLDATIEQGGKITVPVESVYKVIAKFSGEVVLETVMPDTSIPSSARLHLSDGDGADY